MHEARFRTHNLGQMGQEGDHVMLNFALDLIDPCDVELCVSAFFPDFLAASFGTTPNCASASVAWASISNHMRNLVSGDQI